LWNYKYSHSQSLGNFSLYLILAGISILNDCNFEGTAWIVWNLKLAQRCSIHVLQMWPGCSGQLLSPVSVHVVLRISSLMLYSGSPVSCCTPALQSQSMLYSGSPVSVHVVLRSPALQSQSLLYSGSPVSVSCCTSHFMLYFAF